MELLLYSTPNVASKTCALTRSYLLQVFVETLDRCFENVCELDLIFHVDKVHYILQEIVMGGMVLETNMNEVIQRIEDQNKLEKVS